MLRLADSKSIYGIDWQHTLSGGEQDHGADSCQVSSYSSIKDSLVLVGNREGNSEQMASIAETMSPFSRTKGW